MSGTYFLTAIIFIGVGVLLMFVLTRLFRLRGQKDESVSSQEHWIGDVDGGDGGGD